MVRLQTEATYRSLVFASSDYSDASKHPKLRLGLNFCSDSSARKETPKYKLFTPDVVAANGKVQNGITALVRSNLSAGNVTVDYELNKDGKTILELVSINGAILKTMEVDGTKGKHTKTITLDGELLKNKMAVLVVKQGNSVNSSPFIIAK